MTHFQRDAGTSKRKYVLHALGSNWQDIVSASMNTAPIDNVQSESLCISSLPHCLIQLACFCMQANLVVAAGTLPSTWGDAKAFLELSMLKIWDQGLTGSLPAEWGSNGSLPALQTLYLGVETLSGPLPVAWGSPHSFQSLCLLSIQSLGITGILLELCHCLATVIQLRVNMTLHVHSH